MYVYEYEHDCVCLCMTLCLLLKTTVILKCNGTKKTAIFSSVVLPLGHSQLFIFSVYNVENLGMGLQIKAVSTILKDFVLSSKSIDFYLVFCRYHNDVGSPLCIDAGLCVGLRPHSADHTS